MDEEKRKKILNGVLSIPEKNLVNYIVGGKLVTQSDIFDALRATNSPKAEDKIRTIKTLLRTLDESEWNIAVSNDTINSYNTYLKKFPQGEHSIDCKSKLEHLDDLIWNEALDKLGEVSLNQYKSLFPNGRHMEECNMYLSDLPWLEVKAKQPSPTIDDYEAYMRKYPGCHDDEVMSAINDLKDDRDWHNAEAAGNKEAYREYLQKHPSGKYASKAQNAINSGAGREKILSQIKNNRNAYNPKDLQGFIGNHMISETDLYSVFSEEEIKEIVAYMDPTELPEDVAPDKLLPGNTEVYFWGTPSSGKTCAMGAILSAANKYGILHKKQCQGKAGYYMDKLGNIFVNDGIAVFPKGTPDFCIQEMVFSLRDEHDNEHSLAFIDLAGEVFRAMYRKKKNIPEDNYVRQQVLQKTLEYLQDSTNKKIHFFIVAYGEENKKWDDDDLTMQNYLESTMQYLDENEILRKGTNGVYILVSKCDNMSCSIEERQKCAEDYIKEKMPNFYTNMKSVCKNAGVRDFEILPFSVGDVFAQKLCRFNSDNTDIVLDKLILKSPAPRSGFIGSFINWLNS